MADLQNLEMVVPNLELYQAAERVKAAQQDLAVALETLQKTKDAYDAALTAARAASQAINVARFNLFIAAGGRSESEDLAWQRGL